MNDAIIPYELGAYENMLGEIFRLATPGGNIDLTVGKVTAHPPRADKVPFSVIFQSNSQFVLPQDVYRLSHETAGVTDLFIVPIARYAEGTAYEAAFG